MPMRLTDRQARLTHAVERRRIRRAGRDNGRSAAPKARPLPTQYAPDGGYRSSARNSSAVIPTRRRIPANVPTGNSRCSGTATVAYPPARGAGCLRILMITLGPHRLPASALQRRCQRSVETVNHQPNP